ncbi:MAG: HlyC/CorC family transporter [Caldilineaceae bacterium]|nr:HlyC/CorC family transporter [Caldilineaceae bacterium]
MGNLLFDFAVLLLLFVLNGFLSMAELAVVSARKPLLRKLAEDGVAGANTAHALANDPGDFLSTVQIGITLIGIMAGAYSGTTLSRPVAELLQTVPHMASYSEGLAVTGVVLLTTYLSLVVGELTPKRIALNNAERIACFVARPMRFMARLTRALVVLLDRSSELLLRVLGIRLRDAPAVTEEEVRLMLEQGAEVGVFEPIEEEIMTQVFRLSDRRASAIMTPRTEIEWIDVTDTPEAIRKLIIDAGHARYPLARGSLDQVIGIIMVRDLLLQQLEAQPFDLEALARPALFLPESMTALDAVERMREARSHIALIIDEYGGLEGLVTISDVVEAILGAVEAVGPGEEPDIVMRDDGTWLIDGMLSADEFQDYFHIRDLPSRAEADYQTVAGLIITLLERLPVVGSKVTVAGYGLEVMDMDGRRVDKVLVTRIPPGLPEDIN